MLRAGSCDDPALAIDRRGKNILRQMGRSKEHLNTYQPFVRVKKQTDVLLRSPVGCGL
jgi:hypothetical protein